MPEIALFLYEGMTALDAVGPYEVLSRLPEAEMKFVATTPGPKTTDEGLVLTASSSLEDIPEPDIIVIPGSGSGHSNSSSSMTRSRRSTRDRSRRPTPTRASSRWRLSWQA